MKNVLIMIWKLVKFFLYSSLQISKYMIHLLTLLYVTLQLKTGAPLEIIPTGMKFYFASDLNIVLIERTNRRHIHTTLSHGK